MIRTFLLCVALASCACATSGAAKREQAQIERLERENRELRASLGEKNQAATAGFKQAGNAESAAGLANASCAVVSPASGKPAPRSGAVHAKLRLGKPLFLLQPQLSGARRAGGANVAAGVCAVGRR